MKDNFGRELNIGDKIFYSYDSGSNVDIQYGTIEEFTPKMVIVNLKYARSDRPMRSRVSPTRLSKITEEGLIFP